MSDSPIYTFRTQHGLTLEGFGGLFDPPVDKSTVLRWQSKVPAERVLEIERKTGLSRQSLRPDLYPEEEHAA